MPEAGEDQFGVNFRWVRLAPGLVACTTIGAVSLLAWFARDLPRLSQLEARTLDWRMRTAGGLRASAQSEVALVYLDDQTLEVLEQRLGQTRWPLCRSFYGHVVRELTAQGAACIGFDVFFLNEREDRPEERLRLSGGVTMGGDEYFGRVMKASNRVVLGCPSDGRAGVRLPFERMRQSALALGHCVGEPDGDGVHRRLRPFHLDARGERVWALGLVMAAHRLGLDLSRAEVHARRLEIPGRGGLRRSIPLDEEGCMIIDWSATQGAALPLASNLLSLLGASSLRASQKAPEARFAGKMVVVGSTGKRPLLLDEGPTPLGKDTPRCTLMLNLASMVADNRFVTPCSRPLHAGLVLALGGVAAFLSWRFRILWASLFILALAGAYIGLSWGLFRLERWDLPLLLPVAGALISTHALITLYRFLLEQTTRRRRSGLRSPSVIDTLLTQPNAHWRNETREMTVLFADIRGFSAYSDARHREALLEARERGLTGRALASRQHEASEAALELINSYLATVVNAIKQHGGTLDKYMGDCVMAFWGAPLADSGHAVHAVRAAIQAQRDLAELNRRRCALAADAPLLTMGTGINTGLMTVGFMGAEEHPSNYTVFGHAVNVASRLETLSGSRRILVSAATREAVARLEPALSGAFTGLGPQALKGIALPVEVWEVPWENSAMG